MSVSSPNPSFHIVGRYALHGEIASGGMAAVHLGRLLGPVGFSRTVAIKRLHRHFAKDPEFVSMFLDEARLAARIHHPNVVQTLDVVTIGDELFLVMEYVQGETLARLWRGSIEVQEKIPVSIVASIGAGMLHGLHAAHEARDEHNRPLHIVHRDVSPQNVLVGIDGVPRILDFGVAKAAGRLQLTRDGQLKGKLAYMAPEQLTGQTLTAQSDIYAAAVVIWEALAGERLFNGDNDALIFGQVLNGHISPPSALSPHIPPSLDGVILRALDRNPANRFSTAREMALAIEACVRPAQATEVGSWVEDLAKSALRERAQQVQELESSSAVKVPLRAQLRSQTSVDRQLPSFVPTPDPAPPVPPEYGAPRDRADIAGPASHEMALAPPHSVGAAMNFLQGAGLAHAPHPLPLPDIVTRSWTHHTGGGAAVTFTVVPHPDARPAPRGGGAGMKVLVGIATAALVFAIAAAVFAIRGGLLRTSTGHDGTHVAPASPAIATPAQDTAPAATAEAATSTAQAPSPPASGELPPPSVLPLRTGVVAAQPTDMPAVASSAIGSARSNKATGATSAPVTRRAAPPSRPAAPSAKPSCDPPYVRDAAGVKVYKPECLN